MKLFAPLLLVLAAAAPGEPDPLAPEEVPTAAPLAPDIEPTEDEDGRIVFGEAAPPGSAPWQIEMILPVAAATETERIADRAAPIEAKRFLDEKQLYERNHFCGGSYIGGGWIVTAAHCAHHLDTRAMLRDVRIRMGTQNIAGTSGELFAIERIVSNAGWSKATGADDIALIKVRDTGGIRRLGAQLVAIRPQTARDPALIDQEPLRVTGWGWMGARKAGPVNRATLTGSAQHNPANLQQTSVFNVAATRCQPQFPKLDLTKFICAAVGAKRADSCQGDSGGPLTRAPRRGEPEFGTPRRVLAGVVSGGHGCATGAPGIYTRLDRYEEWIGRAKRAGPGFTDLR